jgi:hypothetical protein
VKRQRVVEFTCDQCGVEHPETDGGTFYDPPSGWFALVQCYGHGDVAMQHFCGRECLKKHVEENS